MHFLLRKSYILGQKQGPGGLNVPGAEDVKSTGVENLASG